jgi:tetratricopeptide (TPR) repeat protein
VKVSDTAEARHISAARSTTANRLRRTLQGDLDNIVCMAMRKEPERRYGSPQQMANDIQRYLEGKPVIARSDTLSYRSAKFVRRHWLPVAGGVSLFLLIISFATTMYIQSERIAAERDRVAEQRMVADRERGRAEEVAAFLVNLFKLTDPEENRGNQITARELLDAGAKRLQSALQDQPATKATLLTTIASVYDSLGQYQDAVPILQQSLALQAQSRDRTRLDTLLEEGRALAGSGDLHGAQAPLQDALALAQTEFGATSQETGRAVRELGRLRHQEGAFSDAKALYVRSLDILENTQAPPTEISALLDDLAQVYAREQQWALAKQTYERALEVDRRVLGEDHPRVAMHLQNLAFVMQNLGDLKKAESLYRDAIRRKERAYGAEDVQTAAAKGNYGSLLEREGRFTEAEPLLRSALALTLAQYGPNHRFVGYAHVNLGMLLNDEGDLAAAESEFRQALSIYETSLPATHQWRASADMQLARVLVDRGKPEEALPHSEESLKIWTASSGSNSVTALAHSIHAYVLAHLGRTREAEDELNATLPIMLSARGPDDPSVRRAQAWLQSLQANLYPPRKIS